jgi:hypothetical protein
MKFQKGSRWVRYYIIIICAIRTVLLSMSMARGFRFYFPHISPRINLAMLSATLILEWIEALFFDVVHIMIFIITFILDGLVSYYCGIRIFSIYGERTLFESICFGNIIFIVIDIILVIYFIIRYACGKKYFRT